MPTVGRYQLLETLGEGGMGVVYKAFDPLIQRTVAVKLIAARLTESPELRQRFYSEARAAGQLSHRNIVTIFDLGEEDGHPYFAMEYLEGRNLRTRLQSFEPMSLARKLEVIGAVCEGLAFAHAKGVTHRDIKPANIFITDVGEVKVLDFGLARLPASELTHSKTFIGTLNYMAPEQIAGEKTDHRADIFAVGVVVYEMLSGRSAFEADSVAALLNRILHEEPQPLSSLNPTIPPQLSALVARSMAKAREDRYQSLTDLLIDLAEARGSLRDSDPGLPSMRDLDVTRELPGSGSRGFGIGSGPEPAGRGGSGSRRAPGSSGHGHHASSGHGHNASPVPAHSDAPESAGELDFAASVASRRSRFAVLLLLIGLVGLAAALVWNWRLGRARDGATLQQAAVKETPAVPDSASTAGRSPVRPAESPPPSEPAAGERTRPAPARGPNAPKVTAGRGQTPESTSSASSSRGPSTSVDRGSGSDARADADEAQASVGAAIQDADSANARQLASSTYRSAWTAADAAAELLNRREFSRAKAKAAEASSLFHRAATEARAEQSRRAEAEAATAEATKPPAVQGDPAASAPPSTEAKRPPQEQPAAPPTASRPIAPTEPVPAPRAAPPVGDGAETAIRDLLTQYASALEARDLAALKRVWPGLSGVQERALRAEFAHARSIAVDLEALTSEIGSSTATVVCRRRYTLVTQDGHHLESRNASVFTLRRQGPGWVIESVRHDNNPR